MSLLTNRIPRSRQLRRHARFERWTDHDELSSPSDLVLRNFIHVHGLHR
jgi:hypothetical protein